MVKKILLRLYDAFLLFNKRSGATLAAASSFYVLLTIVPLVLLIIRVVGLFVGDIAQVQSQTFTLVSTTFPSVAPEMIERLQTVVSGPLFGGAKFTIINFIILSWSSISFFNSIWNGLYIMTDDHSYVSLWKHLKGLVVIGITISLMIFIIGVPPLIVAVINFIKTNDIIQALAEVVPGLVTLKSFITSFSFGENFLLKSSLLSFIVFLGYFTLLYRWFFAWKLSWKEAALGSTLFVCLLFLGKNFFWIYLNYMRASLIKNYGDYYTFIVGIIWIFFVMCFFFFGASLCHTFKIKRASLPEREA